MGKSLRGEGATFVGVFSQAKMKFDERRLDVFTFRFLTVGAQWGEGDGIGTRRVVGLAEDGSEQIVEMIEQRLVGTEGQVEVNEFAARGLDVRLDLTEDSHIGRAEAIDGLF